VSPEAIAMGLSFLKKQGFVKVEDKSVGLSTKGRVVRDATPGVHETVLRGWEGQFGRANVVRMQTAANRLLAQREGARAKLALGLEPYPDGWRAERKYLRGTEAMLDDPATGLPLYPMVLHRGGWPDGS
jgi:hypothetical protein